MTPILIAKSNPGKFEVLFGGVVCCLLKVRHDKYVVSHRGVIRLGDKYHGGTLAQFGSFAELFLLFFALFVSR